MSWLFRQQGQGNLSELTRGLLWLFFILFPEIKGVAQQVLSDTLTFRVMAYNTENLFDARHDSLKNDYEFLPDSPRHWTFYKYQKKLDAIAKVIWALGEWNVPALVGLCEVENDSVLYALTQYSSLRNAHYRYIMTHSPDERGINVALLYQRELFKPIATQEVVVPPIKHINRPTRNILHVSGLLLNHDTLDVLICHFPSRSGGAKFSEPYRIRAAQMTKQVIDSIGLIRQRPQIIVMGDLNDYPTNRAVQWLLNEGKTQLHHLLPSSARNKHKGSHKYQDHWGFLDHLMVSTNLLKKDAPLYVTPASGKVFAPSFLLTEDIKYGGWKPFRTFQGMKFQGGFSDHLPVWAEFRLIY